MQTRLLTPNPRHAFTILEVLVSTAILGIVMLVMLASIDTGMRLWKTTQDKISIDREGRYAMFQISRDLQNMITPPTPAPTPFFKNIGEGNGKFMEFFLIKPSDYQEPDSAGEKNVGDVCYVRYKLQDNKILVYYEDSEKTFESLKNNRFPSVEDGDENWETLALNVRRVGAITQNSKGEYQLAGENGYTSDIRSLFCYIEINDPASFGPNPAPTQTRKSQYFTVTSSIPPQ